MTVAKNIRGRIHERAGLSGYVAELTASYVMADLGLSYAPRFESVAYLMSWLKVLKGDTRAIFTAASKAQAAADWMHAQQPGAGTVQQDLDDSALDNADVAAAA